MAAAEANYGYANINSAKQEVGNTYGGVSGGYSYVDAEGVHQQITMLLTPVCPLTLSTTVLHPPFNPEPLVAPVFYGVAPTPSVDTPEVAEAKAAQLTTVGAAKADIKNHHRAVPCCQVQQQQVEDSCGNLLNAFLLDWSRIL